MFWAQALAPGSPAAAAAQCTGLCYSIQCLTGNYSALPQDGPERMISMGSGCPWAATVCTRDDTIDKNTIVCNFGGEDGYDVEAAVSGDGTVLGPAPDFPGSGLGLHRFTGAMTGLWAAVDDTLVRTTAVYLVGHDWTDDSLGVYNFPATSDAVGSWQYATGSAKPQQAGVASAADARLSFNSLSGVGALHGVLNAAADKITGPGGLAGWSKRTGLCAVGDTGPGCAAQRLPANSLNSYRNAQYTTAGCELAPAYMEDHQLGGGCPDYGSAGANFGYNFSSGNLSIHVYDGSNCPCGTYTPVNPWNGNGGDCTCPASRCATNATHFLQYHVLFGMNASTAPCVPIVHETDSQCSGQNCQSQRWYPTPVSDKAACSHELRALCTDPKSCQACADIAANWNKLRVVGCTDALVASLCKSSGGSNVASAPTATARLSLPNRRRRAQVEVNAQVPRGSDGLSFAIAGDYVTPDGKKAHLDAAPDGPLGRLTLTGALGDTPLTGFAQNGDVGWTKFGHGEHDTGTPGLCPGDPPGPNGCGGDYCQCGWTIGCPAPAAGKYPSSCILAPAPGHGCLFEGIPQCRWSNITAAKQYCSEWDECTSFHCEVTTVTDPPGCGDCPQPAGGWCSCTIVTTCQARGNGTTLSGGSSGDQQDYAFFKAGNASGWLKGAPVSAARASAKVGMGAGAGDTVFATPGCHLKPGAPGAYKTLCESQTTKAACTKLNETCAWTPTPIPPAPPAPTGARQFVFSFGTGHIVFADTGEAWTHVQA